MINHTHRIAALCLAMLAGCAFTPIAQTEYNMGVEAFRIHDYRSARHHWDAAVAQHAPHADNNLGFLLYRGLGGAADVPRAIALWTEAARAGEAEPQWHLGQAYEDGKGVERSVTEAYAWYRCALDTALDKAAPRDVDAQIATNANRSLAQLRPKLTPAQLEAGEALAQARMAAYATHGAAAAGG
jgi:TPR repeat protein